MISQLLNINLSPLAFIFLFLMVMVAAIVDSIGGGGGLISLPAYLMVGFSPITAGATNKVTASCGAIMSFIRYYKKGYVKLKLAIPGTIAAIIGSTIGANIAVHISDNILKICMVAILPIAMYVVINKKSLDDKGKNDILDNKKIIICALLSLLIGSYDGFYGPGTGTFLIIVFTSIGRLRLDTANGVAKTINLATNLTSVVVYILNGKPIILLGLICGVGSLIGSFIGTHMYIKDGAKIVRPIMLTVLVIFFIKVIMELVV